MNYSKNHSISKKLAKSTLWISLAAILSPILFYYTQYKDTGIKSVVEFPNKLGIVAPIILFLVYLCLLISMLKQKFEKTDINILFSFSALILSFYLILLYSRIFTV